MLFNTDRCPSSGALALYVLLPSGGPDYLTFVAVAVATMAGVVSHVPGGIGVFERDHRRARQQRCRSTTRLLLFRLVYFLLPFVMALALLSLSGSGWRPGAPVLSSAACPGAAGGAVDHPASPGSWSQPPGLFMMFAGLLRNPTFEADKLQRLLPPGWVEGGALLSSVLGSALVVKLALGLFRRSRAAFWLLRDRRSASSQPCCMVATSSAPPSALLMPDPLAARREFYGAAAAKG